MRTTLDLPEDLLAQAMKLSKVETKTAVIVLALEDLVRKSHLAKLKQYKGKVDLGINLDQLRKRA